MTLDPNREQHRIPGARRLFRAAQHQIDRITSSPTFDTPGLGLEMAWDVILQLGADLDRLARKAQMSVLVDPNRRIAA